MSDRSITTLAWIALAAHLVAGSLALRQLQARPLVPALNLITAACIVVYWGYRWYWYMFRGISWYASDQLFPLYALCVCVLAASTLAGRFAAHALNWVVFAIHTVVFIGAVLFFTFFRMRMF